MSDTRAAGDRGRSEATEAVAVRQVQLKLRLTKAQERTLARWLWHLTAVYNWTLRKVEASLESGVRVPSAYDLKRDVTGHAQKMGVSSYAVAGTIQTARRAWQRCLDGLGRRPRWKGRRRPLSSIAFDHFRNKPKGRRIVIPTLGAVRFHEQRIPDGHVGSAMVVRRATGWYLCLFIRCDPRPIERVGDGEVGIDPGFSSLLTLSSGEKIDAASELARTVRRVGQAQRGSRMALAARLQERVANQRKDRNHKLSRRIVSENALIAFSADSHRAIARRFGKSVASAGHYQLRQMLRYKSLTGGTRYVEVPSRNSTRTCSACGGLTGPTGLRGLKVRQWVCTTCGVEHDRDCNAAVNVLIAGRGMRHESHREMASGTAS